MKIQMFSKKCLLFFLVSIPVVAVIIAFVIVLTEQYTYLYQEPVVIPAFVGTYRNLATGETGSYSIGDKISAQPGEQIVVQGEFDRLPETNQYLYLTVLYAKMKVFANGELVYTFNVDSPAADYLMTTGDVWHGIPIPAGTLSRDIVFEFQPVRNHYPLRIENAYIASTIGIFDMLRKTQLLALILSFVIILLGSLIATFSTVAVTFKIKAHAYIFMGLGAVFSGAWFLFENKMLTFFGISPALSYFLCLFALYAIPIPFLMYCILSYDTRLNSLLKNCLTLNCIGVLFILMMQLFGVLKMVQYIKISHILVMFSALAIVISLGYEYAKTKNPEIKSFGLRFSVLSICGMIEVLNYYFHFLQGVTAIFLFGMVIFFALQFLVVAKGLTKLVADAAKIELYRAMATKDALTGIRNRIAYEEMLLVYQDALDSYSSFGLGVFDINNLKFVNDTYGHAWGDTYIRDCCSIICRAFHNCPVFRIGGDEFVAVFINIDEEKVQNLYRQMQHKIKHYNATSEMKLGIAFGYSFYNKTTDTDFHQIFVRADHSMYLNKQQLKVAEMKNGQVAVH